MKELNMRPFTLRKALCSLKALLVLVLLHVLVGSGVGSVYAGPVYMRYQVTNDDGAGRTATDLILVFNKTVLFEANSPIDTVSITFGAAELLGVGKGIEFSSQTTGVRMGEADVGVVAFPEETQGVKALSGEWSYPVGANRAIPLKQISVRGWKKDNGVVLITNDDSQTLFFTSVLASTNIPSSNFIDPSESQLLALISNNLFAVDPQPDFSLAPGQTKEIDLGLDLADNYTSVIFTADFTPTPSSTATRLGFAGDAELVPEPASWMMLGLGLLLIAGYRIKMSPTLWGTSFILGTIIVGGRERRRQDMKVT